ncbi:unnamed protein product [Ixodes pacificus]
MASISSKKMRQAFLLRAISKSSLTIQTPPMSGGPLTSPTYFWTSSEPMTRMKQASVRLATARAHSVLPVPGGPNSSTPFGGSMPRSTKRSGCSENKRRGVSTTSLSFSICSLQPPTSV